MKSSPFIELQLAKAAAKNLITPRSENNIFLKMSFKGSGTLISEKWNVKIYTSGSIVSNDLDTLDDIVNERISEPDPSLKVLQIDDSGWGFPLCGVMVGVTDRNQILTDVVPVTYFQGNKFKTKEYLKKYAFMGIDLVRKFTNSNKTHRIEICTGYVNSYLKKCLRKLKFDVRVTEIKGLLQDSLETLFKEHVLKETGLDLAYDPKVMKKNKISKEYYKVLKYGLENVPHLLKSGWKSMEKYEIKS